MPKRPTSVTIALIISIFILLGGILGIVQGNSNISIDTLLPPIIFLMLIIGFIMKSNVARIGYFIFACIGVLGAIISIISTDTEVSTSIALFLPIFILLVNSIFVLASPKSKSYFLKNK